MNNKKKSYKQLEKQIENTKALLFRVTSKMAAQTKTMEHMKSQVTVASAYIGYLAKDTIEIEKVDLVEFLEKKAVTWKEDGTKIIINVIEKDVIKEDNAYLCNRCKHKGAINCKLGKSYEPKSCLSYSYVCDCGNTDFGLDDTHCKECRKTLLIK